MAQINTEWDYELKAEVFKVSSDKGYVHKTFTSLTTTKTENDTSLLSHFVATLKVNVDHDIGSSYIVFYDNGNQIPFTIGGTEYTQYSWTQYTNPRTVKLKLGYNVEHNITARYIGNADGLPSTSQPIILFENTPAKYATTLERYNDTTIQYNQGSTVNLPFRFISGKESESAVQKPIKIYIDDSLRTTLNINVQAGKKVGTGTASLSGITKGKHMMRCVFEGDDYNESAMLEFEINVGYDIQLVSYPLSTVQTSDERYSTHNTVTARVLDWNGTPVTSGTVSISNNSVSSTATSNSDGEVSIVCNNCVTGLSFTYGGSSTSSLTLPCAVINETKTSTDYEYISKGSDNKLITQATDVEYVDNGANEEDKTIEGIPVYATDSEGNEYESTLNSDGIATIDFTTPTTDDMTFTTVVGDVGDEIEVEQIWQYLSTNESLELNKRFLNLKCGSVLKMANGYQFKPSLENNSWYCRVGFGYGRTDIGDYKITFKNIGQQTNVILRGGVWKITNGQYTWDRPTSITTKIYFAPNNTYSIEKVGRRIRIYRGTDVKAEGLLSQGANGEPMMEFAFEKKADKVLLDNIEIRKL